MPSAKAARVGERRRRIKAPLRSRAKTVISKARKAMAANELGEAEQAVKEAFEVLDKAAKKRALHPNNAARRKSRIMKQLNAFKDQQAGG